MKNLECDSLDALDEYWAEEYEEDYVSDSSREFTIKSSYSTFTIAATLLLVGIMVLSSISIVGVKLAHAQESSGNIETFNSLYTDELFDYDDALDYYQAWTWKGGTPEKMKELYVDKVKNMSKQLIIVDENIHDENMALMAYKYDDTFREDVLNSKIFPFYDVLYNDPECKPYIRGIVLGDEVPINFDTSFAGIAEYDSYFYAEHGFHLNQTDLEWNESKGDWNNPEHRQIVYQWVRKSSTDALNILYDRFKERYPDWEIWQEPYIRAVMGMPFSSIRFEVLDIEGLKADAIVTTGHYHSSGLPKERKVKSYHFIRYPKSIQPDKFVRASFMDFVMEGNEYSTPNQILFDVMLFYVADIDLLGGFSLDILSGTPEDYPGYEPSHGTNYPIYNSPEPTSEERWNATYSILKFLRGQETLDTKNDVLVIYPYYSMPIERWSYGESQVVMETITKMGIQYDLLPSKYIIGHPEVLQDYKLIIALYARDEPDDLKNILENANVPIFFDDQSFMRDEYGEPTSSDIFNSLMGTSENRSFHTVHLFDYTIGTTKTFAQAHWLPTIKEGDWLTPDHEILAMFDNDYIALLRYKNNFFSAIPTCQESWFREDYEEPLNFIFKRVFEELGMEDKLNPKPSFDFLHHVDNNYIILSNRNAAFPHHVDFTIQTDKMPTTIYNYNNESSISIQTETGTAKITGDIYSTIVLKLESPGTLLGTVSSAENPMPNVTVSAGEHETITNKSGNYLMKLPPGNYTVTTSADGYEPASENVTIEPGNNKTLNFSLSSSSSAPPPSPPHTVYGFVFLHNGTTPAVGVNVALYHEQGNLSLATASDGSYTFDLGNLPAYSDSDTLQITASSGKSFAYVNITVNTSVEPQKVPDLLLNIPPSITLTSPVDGALHNLSSVTLRWTASDDDGDVLSHTVILDGSSYDAGSSSSYTIALADGTHSWKVVASDSFTSVESATRNFTIDAAPPVVTIDPVTSPTNITTQIISGSFTETGSGIACITVNGIEATITGSSFSATVSLLSEGTNTITAEAVDHAGNSASASATILLDTIAPTISLDPVTSPTTVPYQIISGTFTETGSGIKSITVNGIAAEISGSTFYANISLSEGENVITVIATDKAGNSDSQSTSITLLHSASISLAKAWNLISLPRNLSIDVESFGEKANATCIVAWNNTAKSYISHVVGTASNLFDLETGHGYWVSYPDTSGDVTIEGLSLSNITYDLKRGWNLVGSLNGTAEEICSSLDSSSITKWDASSQRYVSHVAGLMSNNFDVSKDESFWSWVDSDTTIVV